MCFLNSFNKWVTHNHIAPPIKCSPWRRARLAQAIGHEGARRAHPAVALPSSLVLSPPKESQLLIWWLVVWWIWWFGGLVVWWFGGLVVWWFGGLVVWWFGGLMVWWFDAWGVGSHLSSTKAPGSNPPTANPKHQSGVARNVGYSHGSREETPWLLRSPLKRQGRQGEPFVGAPTGILTWNTPADCNLYMVASLSVGIEKANMFQMVATWRSFKEPCPSLSQRAQTELAPVGHTRHISTPVSLSITRPQKGASHASHASHARHLRGGLGAVKIGAQESERPWSIDSCPRFRRDASLLERNTTLVIESVYSSGVEVTQQVKGISQGDRHEYQATHKYLKSCEFAEDVCGIQGAWTWADTLDPVLRWLSC